MREIIPTFTALLQTVNGKKQVKIGDEDKKHIIYFFSLIYTNWFNERRKPGRIAERGFSIICQT